jgi:VWFA-related protein
MTEFTLFRWRGVVATAALLAFGPSFLVAQKGSQSSVQPMQSGQPVQPGQSAQPRTGGDVTVIRTNVRRVVLDVVVTGKDGAPVRGLTKDDFTVIEDGRPQTLMSFDVHDFDATAGFVPPKVPPLGPNAYLDLPKGPEKGPLYLILYDLVNIDPVDQTYARSQLRKFIENKPEGARFAIIVFSDGMHLVQGFTSDKNALLAPLDPATNNPHVPQSFQFGANNGRNDGDMEASVFTALAHYMEGFPGRKNVLWVSGYFPLSLFANGDNTLVGDGEYTSRVKEIVDTLARDQIAIYPVNVRGAIVTEEYGPGVSAVDSPGTSDDRGKPLDTSPAIGGAEPAPASNTLHAASPANSSQTMNTNMAADGVAKATGGRAFYGTNNLAALLARATADGSNYYTLSYSPSNGNYNGKLRGIQVELAKRGYQLAYRRSYFGVNQTATPEAGGKPGVQLAGSSGSIPQDDPLSTDMRHGAPMEHDVVFLAQFHAVGAPAMGTPEQMARLVGDPG